MFVQMHTKSREIRLSESSLLTIQILQQRLHISRLPGSRDKSIEVFIKGHQSGFVFFPHGNIRKHQRSINRIIQQSHPTKSLLHHPSFIYHIVNLLRTFILIYIHHKLMPACTRFPVNRTIIVSLYILFDLFKLRMMSHPANTLYSQLGQIITHRQQFILMKHQIRRIHLDIQRFRTGITTGNQPNPSGHKNSDIPKRINTATGRTQTISYRLSFIRL